MDALLIRGWQFQTVLNRALTTEIELINCDLAGPPGSEDKKIDNLLMNKTATRYHAARYFIFSGLEVLSCNVDWADQEETSDLFCIEVFTHDIVSP